MRKTVFIVLAVMMLLSVQLYADASMTLDSAHYNMYDSPGSGMNPFADIFTLFQAVIFSSACGAIVLCKFFFDLLRGYMNPDRPVDGMRKAIVKAVIVVLVVFFTLSVIGYITRWNAGM